MVETNRRSSSSAANEFIRIVTSKYPVEWIAVLYVSYPSNANVKVSSWTRDNIWKSPPGPVEYTSPDDRAVMITCWSLSP